MDKFDIDMEKNDIDMDKFDIDMDQFDIDMDKFEITDTGESTDGKVHGAGSGAPLPS